MVTPFVEDSGGTLYGMTSSGSPWSNSVLRAWCLPLEFRTVCPVLRSNPCSFMSIGGQIPRTEDAKPVNSLAAAIGTDYFLNASMHNKTPERLERIESHLAHLEHQVEQLNEVVIDHGKLIDRLKKEVQRQSALLKTLELDRMKANNSRPPHHEK